MLYDDGGSHNVWRYQNNGDCFGGTYGFVRTRARLVSMQKLTCSHRIRR
jgi:hypothetical protein